MSFSGGEKRGGRPEEPEPVVIRDNRKIDREAPLTSDGAASGDELSPEAVPSADAVLLAERTLDLQRLQAEYANYRRRAERERLAAGEIAVSRALTDLLPVLDNLDRARAHGDLNGGLKAVADQLEQVFTKLGLVSFGEVGDRFDPSIHEAVMHDESPDVTEPTCTTVMRAGYKHNDRLLRPAMVGVTDPAGPAPEAGPLPDPAAWPDQVVADQVVADQVVADQAADPATPGQASAATPATGGEPETIGAAEPTNQ